MSLVLNEQVLLIRPLWSRSTIIVSKQSSRNNRSKTYRHSVIAL